MKRHFAIAAALCVLTTGAGAQIAVTDIGSHILEQIGISKQVEQVAQAVAQLRMLENSYMQLQMTYYALSHVTDLGSAVGALGVVGIRNPLPINPYAVQNLMNGNGGVMGMSSSLGGLFSGTSMANRVYAPAGDTWLGQELGRNGGGIAGVQALSLELYRAAADRMAHLDLLRGQITEASDPATREALIAQIGAEGTAIQNQQVQAQAIGNYALVSQASRQQRTEERRQQEIDDYLTEARANGVRVRSNTGSPGT